ncbi:MAG TPA: penicillin acylase family protein [Mycobacteriales bacterium]|nr:penicillin acylase family protein [Mycobacteriales bacterium]
MRRTPLLLAIVSVASLVIPTTVAAAGPAILSGAQRAIAASAPDRSHASAARHYSVKITRTKGGIPHILGKTFGDIGYGYGYAFAKDNICTMADTYITVEGKRSRYFGPNGSYTQRGNGVTVNNLDSDFFWTEVADSGIVPMLVSRKPPLGPGKGLRAGVRGYVAGYNRYLRSVGGPDGIKDPACHGKPWVHPITVNDAYLRFYQLVLLASSDVLIPGIASATPPSATSPVSATMNVKHTATLIAEGWQRAMGDLGSNAVAVGKAGTRDHKHGLLLGNPHFPWIGPERFYDAQITIPGKVNVTGASLFGVPLVLIGHNRSIAWSHTVSTAFRFTPYQLTLVPGSPTTYLYDGKPTKMQPRPVSVVVRGANGKLSTVHHTLWWTRYGPMINSIMGIPLPWTPLIGFTFRDANVDNFRIFNHFLKTDMAHSAHQVLHILKKYEGIPWVNTIVTDKTGHALYADIGTVPNVTDAKTAKCNTALGIATTKLVGLPVLDGSRSACEWGNDKDAIVPGIFGPSHLPYLFRKDYVTNSNDSYWLSNPHHPLTGYPRIIGNENAPRSLRTRVGLIMTQNRVSGHGVKKGFTLRAMQDEVFSNRQYAGNLWRDQLVSFCRTLAPLGLITTTGGVTSIGNACDVLAKWDGHDNADSKGAILWRRFVDNLTGSPLGLGGTLGEAGIAGPYWQHPFDVKDPVHTPYGLNVADPQVALALGDAINDLRSAHLPLDVSPDKVQGVHRHGKFIPIQGGPGDPNGDFDAIYAPWIAGKGLGDVVEGSSFVQVVTWGKDKGNGKGCTTKARTILTYSESSDPTNPHYDDQTKMFSKKKWIHDRFCAAAIRADKHRTVTRLSGT